MAQTEIRLAREMSLLQVTMIGVGAMIGAGIFVLTGIAAGVAGPGLMLVFLLNGLVTTITAMAYAELGSAFHDAGGGYLWVKTGLPDPNGFLSGWISWFAHAVACSLYALGFGAYFHEVLKALNIPLPALFIPVDKFLAVVVILIFGYINLKGASETGKAGVFVTLAKILVIAFFIAIGLLAVIKNPEWVKNFHNFLPMGFGGVLTAMGLTFIAFEGYEIIAQCSEEVVAPTKNIPKAVFLSLIIVIPIYLLVAFVALGAVDAHGMATWQYLGLKKEMALVEAAQQFISFGGVVIIIGGLLSTMSALNATIFSSSRVAFAMGRDNNLPDFFSRIHKKYKTPHLSLLFSNLLIIVMAVSLPIEDVASAADVMFLLLFIQVNLVLIRLRKKLPDLDRGFRVPMVPLIPILGMIFQGGIALYLAFYSPSAWITIILWIGSGLLIFKLYSSKKEKRAIDFARHLTKIKKMEYRILTAISNPSTSTSIIRAAIPIARKYRGEIVGLSVAEVPDGQPLLMGMDQINELQPMLEKALEPAKKEEIPVKSIIKYAHRISYGIVDTAREEECNFILVGRGRNLNFIERVFSSVVDCIIQQAPVEVGIIVGDMPDKVDTILLPYTDQAHTHLARRLLPAFCEFYGAKVKVVRVVSPALTQNEKEAVKIRLLTSFQSEPYEASVEVLSSSGIVAGLAKASRGCQLIIMGGDEINLFEQLVAPPIPYRLADQTKKPMIIVRKYREEDNGTDSLENIG